MRQDILLYTKAGCSYCDKAKTLLESVDISYTEVVLDPAHKSYEKKVTSLTAKTKCRTFPQIFVDHEFLGGFEELKKMIYKPSFLTKQVIKRDGRKQNASLDKVVRRIDFLANYPTLLKGINAIDLAQLIIPKIHDGIHVQDIDELIMKDASERGAYEPDYLALAARLAVNNLHRKTLTSFKDKMELLYRNVDECGEPFRLLDKRFFEFICRNQKEIEQAIDYRRDYLFEYFGLKTLEKGYLQKAGNKTVERPQDMMMRISIFLHYKCKRTKTAAEKLRAIFECYDLMSQKYFTHASPTLFNAGLIRPGCMSCFLMDTDDNTEGIAHSLRSFMLISKACGGAGLSISKWRSAGSVIRGSNGRTQGVVPFMQLLQSAGLAFNQSSKREGRIAIYIDMHHPDIVSFLRTKLNTGNNKDYCKDLTIALWVPDLFMKRLEAGGIWSLFNPLYCPELLECYGEEYETLYCQLEQKGKYTAQIPARELWEEICRVEGDSGVPYILFKDQINRVSNQKNVGIIRTSNLCAEIVEVCEYKDNEPTKAEFACCTLASIALPEMVVIENGKTRFDYDKLEHVVKIVVRNLNNLLDETYYPVKETERSNRRHRPIGVGVQGLANVFCKFKCAYESKEAEILNAEIFEHLYYYALKASNELARENYETEKKTIEDKGETIVNKKKYTAADELPTTIGAYSTFEGSPLSQGILTFDHYGTPEIPFSISDEKWEALRADVVKYGTTNSLLIALMPTASTSNILGNNEGFEPFTKNIFVRVTLAGEYMVVNKCLIDELKESGLWTPEIIKKIHEGRGSVAAVTEIPHDIRERFKTVWEMSQKSIIDLAAGRQRFVCQSQSMNLHFTQLSLSKFTTAMFRGWKKGLKTGLYYMRTESAAKADMNVIVGESAPECCSA